MPRSPAQRLLLATLPLLVGPACAGGDRPPGPAVDTAPQTAPWALGGVPAEELPLVRDQATRRAIVHLHSPWSHDACDGEPIDDAGAPNAACLEDFRRGLCEAEVDVAWVTDHPDHAAWQPFAERLHADPDRDAWLDVGGQPAAVAMACDGGGAVILRAGFEDELMPADLTGPLADDAEAEHTLANQSTDAAIAAMRAAGAVVLVNHTEGRSLDELRAFVAAGVGGVEVFNLHAAFDPRIRQADLGLDPLGWTDGLDTFTVAGSGAEPDLLVTRAVTEQAPSVASWDALQSQGRVVGVVGSDAHQNVLPTVLSDGERGDSYRRSLRWMSQHLRLRPGEDPGDPEALQRALAEGRSAVIFEIFGTPAGWDLSVEAPDGTRVEGGGVTTGGTLQVICPVLAEGSPRGETAPEITATIFKDGEAWAEGCGAFPLDGPGAYRARFDIAPWHLEPFYGDDPGPWIETRPWVYTQHVRVQ